MKRRTIAFTTILAVISTFCAILTMLINVSNKVASIKEKADENAEYNGYYVVSADDDEVNSDDEGNLIIELPDSRIVLVNFTDATV